MHGVEFTNQASKRGPITYTHNGRGWKPWLPEVTAEPGWVYRVSSPMRNEHRALCWRCMLQVDEAFEGRAHVFWDEALPAADARCTRCGRSYGERPAAS